MTWIGRCCARLAIVAVGASSACKDLNAPDFNNPSIDDLEENPTRSAVLAASTGLLIGARANISEFNGYVSLMGILGRESYNLDGADPRFITQMLGVDGTPLDAGARALGGNLWALRYQNIRNANVVLNALDQLPDVPPDGMTPEEKEATRGFAKTIQALDFLLVINTRHDIGAPIDVNRPISDPPAPIEDRETVLGHIVVLLDEARDHLDAAGASFPFPLSDGFTGFDTPATFRQFNRALLARVEVYRMEFEGAVAANRALAALAVGESFLDAAGALDLGVYHVFSLSSGDRTNGLVDPDLYAHTSIEDDAQVKGNGEPDDRVTRKVTDVGVDPRTLLGVSSDIQFDPLYPSAASRVPVLRNEELILLRAEANLCANCGAPIDLVAALNDINVVRQTSGGLDAILAADWTTTMTADDRLNELLYNKRYSLLFEGGHRWIDWRRYGKLDEIPLDAPSCAPTPTTGCHTMHTQFPLPRDEELARQ